MWVLHSLYYLHADVEDGKIVRRIQLMGSDRSLLRIELAALGFMLIQLRK